MCGHMPSVHIFNIDVQGNTQKAHFYDRGEGIVHIFKIDVWEMPSVHIFNTDVQKNTQNIHL